MRVAVVSRMDASMSKKECISFSSHFFRKLLTCFALTCREVLTKTVIVYSVALLFVARSLISVAMLAYLCLKVYRYA